MKIVFTRFITKVAMVACLATAFSVVTWGQISIDFENNAIPTGWTNTNDMAVVSNPISGTALTNGSYCLSTNGKANCSITSGLIENVMSISLVASRTTNNTNTSLYIDFSTSDSFPTDQTQTLNVTNIPKNSWGEASVLTLSATANGYVRIRWAGTTAIKFIDNIIITQQSGGSTPSISADNVDIAYNATGGSIAYSVSNEVNGGTISAAVTNGNWVTLGQGTSSSISFTCSENDTKVARTATVTLTYTYNTSETVTRAITITQAGNPNYIDNISDITAAGTYAVQGTIVAKSQRGFIVGDGTGYVYYYNQDYAQSDYAIGDNVKLSGSVVAHNGVFEFNNTTTLTAATTSNYVSENPSVLTGAQMDSRVASTTPTQLSSFVQFEGVLSVSGSYFNITSIDGASTAKGSISYPISTDFTSLNGKEVIVTGYYVGVSSSQYYNTMIGTVEEVVTSVPTITVSTASLSGFSYEEGDGPSTTKSFTVSGSNLTDNIALSVSGSDFEMSLSSDSGYASSLTISQSAGEVATTAVYVRLKAGLDEGEYSATITLSSTGATSQTISLTGEVIAPVLAYATLPFSFDGGRSDIATTSGLTQDGLDSDYSSSPKLKFNGTGDYVILQINERPGTLSFDVKGNTFSGGSFKVQTSEDGTTYSDLAAYTDSQIGQNTTHNESLNNLGENVRYIKWVYDTKVNGNVALGNIELSAYVAPSLYTVSWTAGANTDLFVFAGDESSKISNGTQVVSGTTVWVSVDVASGYVFDSLVIKDASNNDISRTTITANSYFSFEMPSSNVTITSSDVAAPPVTGEQYELFTGTLVEGDYIIYYDGSAMKNTVESGRLSYETVTPTNNVITTNDASIVWHIAPSGSYWTIYSADADSYAASTGAKNKAQMLADGTDDKALWTVSGSGDYAYDIVNKANSASDVNAILRNNVSGGTNYGFACYANATGGALSLYKFVPPATINLTATSGGDGFWVSFYSGAARYTLSDGAQAFTMNASHQLYRLGTDGKVIPAGVAVIIMSDSASITLTKSDAADVITVNGGENILAGSDSPVAKNNKQYVLGKKNGSVGFYKYNGDNIPAGKAYYIVNE